MTNEQILLNVRYQLMEEGKIGSTGRFFEMQGEDGELKKVPEPEEIHSFSRWKEYGYGVKRGEKAIAKVEIWMRARRMRGRQKQKNGSLKRQPSFSLRPRLSRCGRESDECTKV